MAENPGSGYRYDPLKEVRIVVRVTEGERTDLETLIMLEGGKTTYPGGKNAFVHELIRKRLYAPRFYWVFHVICAVPLALLVGICVGINLNLNLETNTTDRSTYNNFWGWAWGLAIFYAFSWLTILHMNQTRLGRTPRWASRKPFPWSDCPPGP